MTAGSRSQFRSGVREGTVTERETLLNSVEEILSRRSERPSMTSFELIHFGAVYLNDERCLDETRLVDIGANLRVHTSPRRFSKITFEIAAENEECLVVKKPAGFPLEATVDNLSENLISYLEEARHQSFYKIQNLEIESTGLVVLAKTSSAQKKWQDRFREGNVNRVYSVYTVYQIQSAALSPSMNLLSCELHQGNTDLLTDKWTSWKLESTASSFYRSEISLRSDRPVEIRNCLVQSGNPVIGDTARKSPLVVTNTETFKREPALALISIDLD